MVFIRIILAAIGCLLVHLPAAHGADFGLCGGGFVLPDRPVMEQPPEQPGVTAVEADDADLSDLDTSVLRGNVQVMRDRMQLSADEVYYSKQADTVDARGNVQLWEEGVYITGSRGVMEVSGETTVVDEARFKIVEAHGNGTATRLVLSGEDVVKAKAGSYTTCDPQDPDWLLRASDVKLTKSENEGIARNVWLDFKGVPIFYSPFLSFPLTDARKSGFLAPSFGISDTNGIEATVPYYFNILPNMDATVAARGMSDRGVQLQGEYRYLFPFGSGELGLEVLPNDSKTDSTRTGVSVKHRSTYDLNRWQSEIDFAWVSDREYFEDLGTSAHR
jgi:LPS-assembly protein